MHSRSLQFAAKARSIDLAVSESKKTQLVSAAKDSSIEQSVEIYGYNFEVVKNFIYLGVSINTTTTTSFWKSDLELLLLIDVTLGYASN